MNKKIMLFVSLAIILIIGVSAYLITNKSSNNLNIPSNNSTEITADQLLLHNNIDDCWIAYKGKVYDITAFLPKHPGSAKAITPFCGTSKEFEDAFTKKHGTTKAALLMQVGKFMGEFKVAGNLQG